MTRVSIIECGLAHKRCVFLMIEAISCSWSLNQKNMTMKTDEQDIRLNLTNIHVSFFDMFTTIGISKQLSKNAQDECLRKSQTS